MTMVNADLFVRQGEFEIGGFSLPELLRQSPTPFYVYSGEVMRERFQQLAQSLPGIEVFYSLKANPHPAICRLLHEAGARAEVSSVRELSTVRKAGFPAHNVIFLSPGKTQRELEAARKASVYALVAESADELMLIEELAARHKQCPGVLLRINTKSETQAAYPGVQVRETMVGGASKFGFDEETVAAEVRRLGLRRIRLLGIQVYSASQVLSAPRIAGHFEYVLGLARRLSGEIGFPLHGIDFGGGFGVPYESGDKPLNLRYLRSAVVRLKRKHAAMLSEGCRLIAEAGRFLVAESGVFITRVIRVKQSRGKRFLICDGGMNHFSRPVFMRVRHQVKVLNRLSQPATTEYEVCGPLCTPLDVLATGCRLPECKAGDTIGVFGAGAYGYSMSLLNFLSLGLPGEIVVDQREILSLTRRTC